MDYAEVKIALIEDHYTNDPNQSTISIRNSMYGSNPYHTGTSIEIYSTGDKFHGPISEECIYNGTNILEIYSMSSYDTSSGWVDLVLAITAEFPDMDTGYMEEDFDFCINEGLNLVSYPCENDIAINDALPSEISNNLSSIVGEGVAGVNVNGTWVGSLTQLQAGSGYWFKSSIEACFNYECAEN